MGLKQSHKILFGYAVALILGIALVKSACAQDQQSVVSTNNNTSQGVVPATAAVTSSVPVANVSTDPSASASPSVPTIDKPADKKIMIDTLELREMDINDVLKLLAAKSGLNIIAGRTVQGRVTIFLQNVEVHDALKIILKSNDLAYVENQGIVQIIPAAEYEQTFGHKFGIETQQRIIQLKSMKAVDVVSILNQVKSAAGKVIADDQSNTVMIQDVPEKLDVLEDYLASIDVPTKWQTFKLQHVPAEGVANKLTEQITPKIGIIKVDAASNKILIKDTAKKLVDFQDFIAQIDVPRQTFVYEVNYAKAEDLAKTVGTMLTKDIGTVQFDARSNKLIITDIAPKIEEMKTVLVALDKYEKEVLIEARIIQIDLNDSYQMGVDWETMIRNAYHVDLKSNFGTSTAATGTGGSANVGTLAYGQYNIVLQALAKLTKSRILSNPRIAVINNHEASILVGTNQPYVTETTTTTATGPNTTADSVNFIDVGVKLHVTPMIHDDNYITMKIKPEVSTLGTPLQTSQGNKIPVVDTSEAETTIRVKDGVTIVIGGLMKDQIENDQSKIPVLGDIPWVGKAFRADSRSVTKKEIVIFLTPHIISGDAATEPEEYPFSSTINPDDAALKIKPNKTYYNPLPDTNQ
jgi:general secretion pathway protein D